MGSQFSRQGSNLCLLDREVDFFLMNLFNLNGTKMSIFNDERYNSQRRQISQTIIHLHNKETKIHEAKIRSKVNS